MAKAAFRNDEKVGLGVAVLLHAALVGVLLFRPEPDPLPAPPDRVTVSLAENVGLEAASPTPVRESRAAIAPTLSDVPSPPELQRPATTEPVPAPRSAATTAARRQPDTTRRETRRQPEKQQATAARSKPKPSGGSRIGSDFLAGSGSSTDTSETRAPAATFGQAEQAALAQAINRQLKPRWSAPQGVDAEKLVTVLSWRMNSDGSLASAPKVVSQSGINDSNRAQAQIHAERAIRAVQLAAPFTLPEEFYDKWKYIRDWRFDRRL